MEDRMKQNKKRSLDKYGGLNSALLRDHINITTIHRKNKVNLIIIKYICIAGLLITMGYLMGCVYLDWAGLYE